MKTLIISPHADDEVFGAFSFLEHAEVGIISVEESKVHGKRPSIKDRIMEANKVSNYVGESSIYHIGYELPVNHYHLWLDDLAHFIECKINDIKPELLLIPYPSINQDHSAVYQACLIALRHHDKNHFVKKVLMYECPQSYLWGDPMTPNYFKEVDIKKKLKAYKLYKSQVRSYRSLELLKRMAEHRGKQAKLKYAEGFRVLRYIE